ncbi:MAG: hypothetical protein JWM93_2978, partial [Frankiales bacterium]|nr:hypothetical protein [Frankiales bacterium]
MTVQEQSNPKNAWRLETPGAEG